MNRNERELHRRLRQAEEVLTALQSGEVDAVVHKSGVALLRVREVEQSLRRTQEDFLRAQALAEIGSWHLDVERKVLTWSDENWRIFGLSRDTALTYEAFLSCVHPEDRDVVDEKWAAALNGVPYDIEHRVVVEGTIRWVRERAELERDTAGNVTGAFGTTQDITRQKQTEEALRRKERQLEAAMKAGHVFTFEWYPASDLIYRSENCSEILGSDVLTCAQTTTTAHFARIHEEDRVAYTQLVHGLTPADDEYETEYRYRRQDGRIIWMEESGRAEFDVDGTMVSLRGIAADATARIEAQEREKKVVAASTAARAAIDTVNAMGEGVALLDPSGRVENVNPAFASLAEYDVTELQGQDIRQLLPEIFDADYASIQANLVRVALARPTEPDKHDALRVTTGRGTQKWIIPTLSFIHGDHDQIVGLVLTLRDITPLVDAQQELVESERRYRELVENANSVIIRITPDHHITFFNEYAQSFFGYTADEVLGKSVLGTIVPRVDSQGRDLKKMTKDITAHPELHAHNENENLCKDGHRVWMQWSNRAIRDERGEVTEILCVGTDATERRRMQEEAAQYRQRLRALSDRLTQTEEQERRRVSTQIHDTVIQTLSLSNMRMGAILRGIQTAGLKEEAGLVKKVRTLIDKGIAECRGLMADLTPPLLYELGLEAAIKDFAEKQREFYGMSITVQTEGAATPLDEGRRGLLFQSARELIINAEKHAGPCRITVTVTHGDGAVRLCVEDTGQGFDPAANDLFDTRDDGGFGLFNIRERLRGLGGDLEMVSTPGEGTTATISVPLATREPL